MFRIYAVRKTGGLRSQRNRRRKDLQGRQQAQPVNDNMKTGRVKPSGLLSGEFLNDTVNTLDTYITCAIISVQHMEDMSWKKSGSSILRMLLRNLPI